MRCRAQWSATPGKAWWRTVNPAILAESLGQKKTGILLTDDARHASRCFGAPGPCARRGPVRARASTQRRSTSARDTRKRTPWWIAQPAAAKRPAAIIGSTAPKVQVMPMTKPSTLAAR